MLFWTLLLQDLVVPRAIKVLNAALIHSHSIVVWWSNFGIHFHIMKYASKHRVSQERKWCHMSVTVSQTVKKWTVSSTASSGWHWNYQRSALSAFCEGSSRKGIEMRQAFPCYGVIMILTHCYPLLHFTMLTFHFKSANTGWGQW